MDTCKIAPGLYQYTAIDDCTRIRVLALYKRRSAANSLLFLEKVIEDFPFPIQRIQTDRGREFFAYAFQEKLMEYGIKFRPLRPASPLSFANNRSGRKLLCCSTFIAMVEAAELWNCDNLSDLQHRSRKRTLLVEAQMGSRFVVVAEIRRQRFLEMASVQDDVVVQTLPSNRAD